MITLRKNLKTQTLYFEEADGMYFWTSDNLGVFWMDESEAILEFGLPLTFITVDCLEDLCSARGLV